MSRSPTLAEVILSAVSRGAAELRVAMPASIESFDPKTQLAKVKPLLKETTEQEDGTQAVKALPFLFDVPVQFPGGGGFAQTWPVAKGDPCLLVFMDRSIDRWIANGGDTDPADVRRHDFNDAVAILGVRAKPGALAEFDASRAVWGNKGPRVAVDGSTVHLGVADGESATEAAMLGSKYTGDEATMLNNAATQLTTAATEFTTLAAAAVGPLAPLATAFGHLATAMGAISAQFQSFAAAQSTRLSTKVKVK